MNHLLRIFNLVLCFVTLTVGAQSLNELIEQRTHLIVKKCVGKSREIREERICESKKEIIKACLHDESKTKDIDKAQKACEHLYIL